MDLNLGSTRALIDECRRQGLPRNQCAYVLATAYWETAGAMKPVKETTSKKRPNPTDAQVKAILTKAWKAGKLPWVKKDYWSAGYFGRGFPQLTHLANYQKASDKLGVDFVAHPDWVMKLEYAVLICVTGMREGWFTGKKLADFMSASISDFFNARSIINADKNVKDKGAKETHGQLIAEMAREYDMDLQVSGYGPKKPTSAQPAPLATIPPIVPEPAPEPAPATDESIVSDAQVKLKALGYNPGGTEGTFGPLTKDAVLSFRHDNNLPVSEVIDSEFLTALAVATPRKMIPARANAKPSDVTALVPEARHNWLSKITAGGLGGTAGVGALVDGVLKNVTDAKSRVNEFTDYLANVPGWAWCLAILAVAGFIYWKSQQSEDASVEAFKTGDRR